MKMNHLKMKKQREEKIKGKAKPKVKVIVKAIIRRQRLKAIKEKTKVAAVLIRNEK